MLLQRENLGNKKYNRCVEFQLPAILQFYLENCLRWHYWHVLFQ